MRFEADAAIDEANLRTQRRGGVFARISTGQLFEVSAQILSIQFWQNKLVEQRSDCSRSPMAPPRCLAASNGATREGVIPNQKGVRRSDEPLSQARSVLGRHAFQQFVGMPLTEMAAQ